MRIDPINSTIASEINKVEKAKKEDTAQKTKAPKKSDSTIFSSSARRLSETKAQISTVSAHLAAEPEIRQEKVDAVRSKINQGYYNSPEFVDKLADKLLSFFGISDK